MNRGPAMQMKMSISPTVKKLIIANVFVWVVFQIILEKIIGFSFKNHFALFPGKVIFDLQIWQLASYMFLHTYSPFHILFNMLLLWWLGTELEERWGRKFFLTYYLLCGIGAAVIYCLGVLIYAQLKSGGGAALPMMVPVMGASGAGFGLLLAYGILFGERVVHFMMMFPMKAKYMVMIMGAVEMSSLLTSDVNGGDVAYLAHLGGLAAGYIVLMSWGRMQRFEWNRKVKKRQSKLRLVVDNEKPKAGEGPKYWN